MSAELFDAVFGTTAIAGVIDDAAILDALCEAETALVRACARVNLIPLPIALEVAAACEAVRGADLHELARRSLVGGSPVVPLVAELRARVESRAGAEAARAVHFGASSQDILDTALMLVAKRALGVIIAGLAECGDAAATLARTHRDTAMVARTRRYQAVPTSFGALAAVWGTGLDRARLRLSTVRASLPVQLGGAAGTLLPMYPHGLTILTVFADETDLAEPHGVWHTDRTPITELAGALGTAAAAIGKVATDIVVLASGDVGEVHEPHRVGSSAAEQESEHKSEHRHNPIAAVTSRAAAAQAPGLVATLLAAGSPELQHGAGSWHAEWPALLSLLRHVGGAASRLWAAIDVDVDSAAMAHNLSRQGDGFDIADLGHAGDLVDRYLDRRQT